MKWFKDTYDSFTVGAAVGVAIAGLATAIAMFFVIWRHRIGKRGPPPVPETEQNHTPLGNTDAQPSTNQQEVKIVDSRGSIHHHVGRDQINQYYTIRQVESGDSGRTQFAGTTNRVGV